MGEGAGQEGFFWNTYPWVMSGNNSSGGSGEGGGEEKSSGGKNLSDMSKSHSEKKQPKKEDMDGTSGGDREVAATVGGGGSKKTDDVLEVKKEVKTLGDGGNKKTDDVLEVKKEIKTIGGGGSKKSDDVVLEVKKEIKTEVDEKVSVHNDYKAKRELVPDDHEFHILTERERRKKMRDMFHELHALMPQLPEKADKSAIVDEAISYIKTLEQTLQRLETKKLEMLYGTPTQTPTASQLAQPQSLAINNMTRESFLADQGSSTGYIGKASPSSATSLTFPLCSPKVFQTWVSPNVTLNVLGRNALISICSSPKPGLFTAICFVLEKYKLDVVSAQISSNESKSLYMIHAQANACDQFMETFYYDDIYHQAVTEITDWVNSI